MKDPRLAEMDAKSTSFDFRRMVYDGYKVLVARSGGCSDKTGKVLFEMTMAPGGFVAGPNDDVDRLHEQF